MFYDGRVEGIVGQGNGVVEGLGVFVDVDQLAEGALDEEPLVGCDLGGGFGAEEAIRMDEFYE